MNTDFSNIPISKRALELKDVTDKIREIWRNNEGPLENVFRILSYLIPFVPGLGWGVFALERLATFFGWGLGDLGGALDKSLGLEPGPHVDVTKPMIEKGLSDLITSKTGSSEEELVKIAWVGGFLKLIGGIPKLANWIWKAIKALLLMFMGTKLGDMYTEATGSTEMPGEKLLEEVKEDKTKPSTLMSEEDVKGLMGLTDPTKLIRPFIG